MMKMIYLIYKVCRWSYNVVKSYYNNLITRFVLKGNPVSFASFRTGGIPYVM